MKVQIRELVGTKWQPMPIEQVVGQSICNYLVNASNPIVAALFNDQNETIAYVSNRVEWVENYKKKGFSINASDLQELLGTDIIPPIIATTFPNSTFVEVKAHQGQLL